VEVALHRALHNPCSLLPTVPAVDTTPHGPYLILVPLFPPYSPNRRRYFHSSPGYIR